MTQEEHEKIIKQLEKKHKVQLEHAFIRGWNKAMEFKKKVKKTN